MNKKTKNADKALFASEKSKKSGIDASKSLLKIIIDWFSCLYHALLPIERPCGSLQKPWGGTSRALLNLLDRF